MSEKKKIGLFFGTFNPMHRAHLLLANHIAENSDLYQVWFIITPKSPFKKKVSLASDIDRYQMVFDAIEDYPKFRASKIEFGLPQPNYTADTLAHLEEQTNYQYDFCLIMGEDNLAHFHKWKNYESLLANYQILVYPRVSPLRTPPLEEIDKHESIKRIKAPIIELSSSYVREQIKLGHELRPLLPGPVYEFIDSRNLYR